MLTFVQRRLVSPAEKRTARTPGCQIQALRLLYIIFPVWDKDCRRRPPVTLGGSFLDIPHPGFATPPPTLRRPRHISTPPRPFDTHQVGGASGESPPLIPSISGASSRGRVCFWRCSADRLLQERSGAAPSSVASRVAQEPRWLASSETGPALGRRRDERAQHTDSSTSLPSPAALQKAFALLENPSPFPSTPTRTFFRPHRTLLTPTVLRHCVQASHPRSLD